MSDVLIQFKRGSQSGWMDADKGNDPVLAQGEPGYHKETKGLKIGDGKTKWSELPYISSPSNIQDSDGIGSLIQSKDTESWNSNNQQVLDYITNNIGTADDGHAIQTNEDGSIKVISYGKFATSLNGKSQSLGKKSFTSGSKNIAFESNAHAEGNETFAAGKHSHAEGNTTSAMGNASHSEGISTIAKGLASHAEGSTTNAEGKTSHAEGSGTKAIGYASHSEGSDTKAIAGNSHVEGHKSVTYGDVSHTEGYQTSTYGYASHAEGYSSNFLVLKTINGDVLNRPAMLPWLKENPMLIATGVASHAEGQDCAALGNFSHAQGLSTVAYSNNQLTLGRYNEIDTNNDYSVVVGNGESEDSRSNALTVDWSGNANIIGEYTSATGADYAEYFEWVDGNPNDEDRVGYLVSLNDDKIELATDNNDILGIVSGTAAIVGDVATWDWQGKYMTDEFGRVIWDMVEEFSEVPEIEEVEVIDEEGNTTIEYKTTMVTKSMGFFPHRRLNPNYDESQTYIPRSKRPEWDCVGLMGKLHVRDDGTCVPGGYATAGVNGIATYSSEKTNMKVMKRLSDNIILVFMK